MIIRRKRRDVPGLNTTSTADISFMLLIFFLVTTSMDADKGLMHRLPPPEQTAEQKQTEVDRHMLMTFEVTADNKILLDGTPAEPLEIRTKVLDFITRKGAKHIISIHSDADAAYNTYFILQNEIVAAYNKRRDELAKKKFGKKYTACDQMQKDEIRELCPQRISETYDKEGGVQ